MHAMNKMKTKPMKKSTYKPRPIKIRIFQQINDKFRFLFVRNGIGVGERFNRRQDAHKSLQAIIKAIRKGNYAIEDL